jgi:hypothetical protein
MSARQAGRFSSIAPAPKSVVFSTTFQPASFARFSLPAWRALLLGRTCRQCVAQLFKLLYRRFAAGAVLGKLEAIIGCWRARRLKIGETAG